MNLDERLSSASLEAMLQRRASRGVMEDLSAALVGAIEASESRRPPWWSSVQTLAASLAALPRPVVLATLLLALALLAGVSAAGAIWLHERLERPELSTRGLVPSLPMRPALAPGDATLTVQLVDLTGMDGEEVAVILVRADEALAGSEFSGFKVTVAGDPFSATRLITGPNQGTSPLTGWPAFGEDAALGPGDYILILEAGLHLRPYRAWVAADPLDYACALPVVLGEGQRATLRITDISVAATEPDVVEIGTSQLARCATS